MIRFVTFVVLCDHSDCLEDTAEESGAQTRRKRSGTAIIETEMMFSNETLALASIDSHKKSDVTNLTLADSGLIPQPSTPTVCPSDLVDSLDVPDHLGNKHCLA